MSYRPNSQDSLDIPVLIPAYNPDERMVSLVRQLRDLGFHRFVIVNDGSQAASSDIFEELKSGCTITTHAVNLGKGRALKTGFNLCYTLFPDAPGLVTVDADGQHTPGDVRRVADALSRHPDKIVIGVRTFSGDTPWRSLIGNVATRYLFQLLIGKKVSDTQSGLRGIPRALLPEMLRLGGEKYDYEMNLLIYSKRKFIDILEVPIRTIYIDNNRASHFNACLDSLIIYYLLFKFAFSSVLAGVLDTIIFYLCIRSSLSIATSVLVARPISSAVNFLLNKRYVFESKKHFQRAIIEYYALVCLVGFLSYLSILALHRGLGMNIIVSKVISETALFLLSFLVQRDLIFQRKD